MVIHGYRWLYRLYVVIRGYIDGHTWLYMVIDG